MSDLTLLRNKIGHSLTVELVEEGTRFVAPMYIDGLLHHFERIPKSEFVASYTVDSGDGYDPIADKDGYCYVLVPASC